MGEACESGAVEVDGEGLVGGAEGVDAHVELAAAEEEGVEEVALGDVGFGGVVAVEGFPARDVGYFVEDEYAFSLALGGLDRRGVTGFMIQSDLLSFCVFLNY
jgi:hypothetical protein